MADDQEPVLGDTLTEEPASDLVVSYCNYASVAAAPDEFIFRFSQRSLRDPGTATERVRIYMPAGHAKRLLIAMGRTIKAYEELFGDIPIEPHLTPRGKEVIMGLTNVKK